MTTRTRTPEQRAADYRALGRAVRSLNARGAPKNPPVADEDRVLLASLFGAALAQLDELARRYTASRSLVELVIDPGGIASYRPTLYPDNAELVQLADAYDAAQLARGDVRRAYRGSL